MKLNFRNKKFLQYQLEFYQENQLSLSARELYSFIYTHCVFYSDEVDQGWCGLSNGALAQKLECTTRTIERNLVELKVKDMIIIENPRKRKTKTGESRQIHINAKNYIVEEISEQATDKELLKVIERQNKQLEELQKEVNRLRLEQAQATYINELGHSLIKTGFITESRYQEQAQELNHILLDFESWHREGRDLTKACFNYWNAHKDTEVRNYVKYILTCIDTSKNWINKKDRTVEEYEEEFKKMVEGIHSKNG